MSMKNASEFCTAIKDEKLVSKFADLNGKKITEEIFNERFLPIAKEMGYDFTYLELIEAIKQPQQLSENELDSVAGGGFGGGEFPNTEIDINIILSDGKIVDISIEKKDWLY